MNLKKILIVEDEPLAANNLIRQIQTVNAQFDILPVVDTIKRAVQVLENQPPDLLFLDIQLSDGLSFEIFQHCSVTCPIIFTTAYDEFAIQAFEHNSIAYLLKPITEEKVQKAFSKWTRMRSSFSPPDYADLLSQMFQWKSSTKYKTNFLVKKGPKLVPIESKQIAFFLAEDKCVFLMSREGQRYLCNDSLNQLETQLDPQSFFRLSRQYLVSRAAVVALESYSKGQVMAVLSPNNKKVVVSRKQTASLKEWLQH